MGVSIQVLRVIVVARTHSLNAYEPVPERLRKVMTVSEVVNTISSLAQFFGFVNKYLYEGFEFGIERIAKRCAINFG